MSGLGQKVRGNLYLAYRALVAHPLRRLFEDGTQKGSRRFLLNYGPEGNIPFTLAEREVLKGASRCIHCGLCDAFDRELVQLSRVIHPGASLIPVSYARATPDLPRARAALNALSGPKEGSLARSEALCPTRVPLRALAQLLREKLAQYDAIVADAAASAPAGGPEGPKPPRDPKDRAGALPARSALPSKLADRSPDRAVSRGVLTVVASLGRALLAIARAQRAQRPTTDHQPPTARRYLGADRSLTPAEPAKPAEAQA